MRPNVVVGVAEAFEHALLHAEICAGRFCGVGLESAMHAFMGSVLLRITGGDALMSNAELQPLDVQLGEAVDAGGSERRTIVTSDGVG